MKQTISWLNIITLFVFTALFTPSLLAVDITLDNTITEIQGDGNASSCVVGDVYRLGTTASYDGQALDILVEIIAEDNEYDQISQSNGPCVDVVNGLLSTKLRDTDTDNDNAFMDFKITIVAQGGLSTASVAVDRLTFTAFDLDKNNATTGEFVTGTDDIYMISPTEVYPQLDANTEVTYESASFGSDYNVKFIGKSTDCNDSEAIPNPTCRGGGIAVYGYNGSGLVSSIHLRISNDNAFGQVTTGNAFYDLPYRGMEISFKEIDFQSLLISSVDHGDLPISYGDASHAVDIGTVLGFGMPADNDVAQYSVNADIDDRDTLSVEFDDEDAVRIGNQPTIGTELNMTIGETTDLNVTTNGTGYLSIWLDFNGDGSFTVDEQILIDSFTDSTAAVHTIVPVTLPNNNYAGISYARFRFDSAIGAGSSGARGAGEVEDYKVNFIGISDIVLNKTVDNLTPNIGDTVTYTITVTNNGPADVTRLVVTDVLPTGLSLVSGTPSTGSWTSPEWNVSTLASGASETLMLAAKVDAGTSGSALTNTVSSTQDQTDSNVTSDTPSATVTVGSNTSDIVLNKTVDNLTPNIGDTVTYTITVTNNGPADVTRLVVTDVLPTGLSLVSGTPSTGSWTSPEWNVSTLASGASETLMLAAKVDAGTSARALTNTVSSTQDQTDSNVTSDTPSATVTVGSNTSDIVLNKTVDNLTPNIGDTVTYTITVTNNGPADVTRLVVTDVLPTGLSLVSGTPSTGSWTSPEWNVSTLASGASETLMLTAKVDAGTSARALTNTVSSTQDQTDSNVTSDTPSATVTVGSNTSDIVLNKTVDNLTPNIGDTVTYTITVTNNGPADVTRLVVTDVLPTGLSLVSGTPSTGSWTSPEWNVSTLASGASETLMLAAKVDAGTSGSALTNTVSSTQDQTDSNVTSDTLSATVTVGSNTSDIVLNKTVDNLTPNIGDTVTYTITVTNNGPADVTRLVVTDVLPTGLSLVSGTPSTGSWTSPEWNVSTLASGASETLMLAAKVDAGTSGSALTNTVSSTQDQTDSNVTSDTPSATVTVGSNTSDIVLNKTVDNLTPNIGDTVTYTITVTNNGPADVTRLVVTDVLPTGLSLVSGTPSTGSWTSPEWNVSTLASGASETLMLAAKVDAGTSGSALTNTVSSTQDQTDSNVTSDTASATVTVAQVQEDAPETQGDTITVTNVGEDVVIDVLANDRDAQNNIDPNTIQLIDSETNTSVSAVIVPNEGIWIVNPEGTVTFMPEAGFIGNPTPVEYTVEDTVGNVSNPSTITVLYPQDATVAVDDIATGITGESVIVDVLANDTDEQNDTDPNTIQLIDPETNTSVSTVIVLSEGIWTVNPEGTVTFTPEAGFTGNPTPVEYTVEDTVGNVSNPSTITVEYATVTILPLAIDDILVVNHYGSNMDTVVSNDQLGEGEITEHIWSLLRSPEHGSIEFNEDGSYTYYPDANYDGSDYFEYMMMDAIDQTSTARVTINVDCASSQESDSGNAFGLIHMLIMMFMTIFSGFYFVKIEAGKGEK